MAAHKLRDFFESHTDVCFLRFLVMDHSSALRVSVMPRAAALDVAEHGSFNSPASAFVCAATHFDKPNWDAFRPGVDKIIPDWDSLRVCTFYSTHAMVMCAVREPIIGARVTEAEDESERNQSTSTTSKRVELVNSGSQGSTKASIGSSDDNDGFDLCPRTILAKQTNRAGRIRSEIDILVGIELEFYLYKPVSDSDFTRPKPNSNFNISALYDHQVTHIVDEISLVLAEADINIMKYLPEMGASGLFELVLPPYGPMKAADAMVYCRETIKNVAQKHGYKATLCPSPFEHGARLGAHTSISINSDAATADSFLGGILESLISICAFAMPSVQSGKRYAHVGPMGLVRWGKDNKVCVVRERRPGLWEVRCPDGTMNPYLTIAALIAAGISGIETEKKLTIKPSPSISIKPLTDEEKSELGIVDSIPDSLAPLLAALKKDVVLKTTLGDRFVQAYTKVKELEIEVSKDMTLQEISERLRVVF
ncbi:glutamine synthetase [Seiridium cupressi]